MGFVFYDTETTGLRPGWDQIVQFAAIRTDENLNEIERFEVRSRLQPHVVPHPAALLTNGLPIDSLLDRELPTHYAMACQIRRRLLAWSPAIFLGYNSIHFDEEMLRNTLFQSLHPAYLTSNHGNSRTDVLGLMHAASAQPTPCLQVALVENGRPTFKLEHIARANGLLVRKAHDAMADAETALELSRLVRNGSSELWQRFVRFSKKATAADFVAGEDAFVLTEFFANEAYHHVVACIGPVPNNPNGRFCLDLSRPIESWAAMDDETLAAEVRRKGGPVRRLAVNAAPTLTALWEASDAMLVGLDPDVAEERARGFKDDPALCARIIQAYTASWRDRAPSPHPEERLYDGGFPSPADEARMFDFHGAGQTERTRIVRAFDDPRLREFGRRLVHNGYRNSLDEETRAAGDHTLAAHLLEEKAGPLTLHQALQAVDDLLDGHADDPMELLPGFRQWLVLRIARAQAVLDQRHYPPPLSPE